MMPHSIWMAAPRSVPLAICRPFTGAGEIPGRAPQEAA